MANYDLDYEGSVVQDILDTGKSLEDDGYIFLGTATPSTIPGTPTERVAYVGGPGTYNNFGTTVVVPSGSIVVITYSGSAWSKTVINASLPVSTTLENNDTTIPTGKAVKTAIDAEATARGAADTSLQNAITTINTKLGEGYLYAGIATAATNPGTPTVKVFYLARQAGTYTNFGGLTLTEGVNILKYNGTAWSQEQLISIADIYKNPLMGYYECDTAGGTAAKTVTATGYVRPTTGGSVKIKINSRNTVANATLNINSTGAKPLFYNGARAGVGNTWDTNEIVEVFYDGTNYQAYNVAGSNGDGVFDISAYNLTDGQPTPYVDLAAALGTDGEHVPQSLRKGGMSVKFIQGSVPSSDNKYVQYRLMADEWSTNTEDWSFCGDDVLIDNPEYIKVWKDKVGHLLLWIKADGSVDWSIGVPKPVIDYVNICIAEILNGNEGTDIDGLDKVFAFLDDFSTSDTLSSLLNTKVDKETGKSLIGSDVAARVHFQDIPEYSDVELDENGNILGGREKDGTKFENMPFSIQNAKLYATNSPEFGFVFLDEEKNIIVSFGKDGVINLPKCKQVEELKSNDDVLGGKIEAINGYVDFLYLPKYYFDNNYLSDKTYIISKYLRKAAINGDSFYFITDTHWEVNQKHSPGIIAEINKNLSIQKIFHGGDVYHGNLSEDDYAIECTNALRKAIGNDHVYTADGNHEFMNGTADYDDVFAETKLFLTDVTFGGINKNYYFFDNRQQKIRYICLYCFGVWRGSSYDDGFVDQEQLEWLRDVALDTETDYDVVVFAHYTTFTQNGIDWGINQSFRDGVSASLNVKTLLDNYSNGTGKVIGMLAGHAHRDLVNMTECNFPLVVDTCDNNRNFNYMGQQSDFDNLLKPRTTGTIDEQAFDAVIINKDDEVIHFIRLGSGADNAMSVSDETTEITADNQQVEYRSVYYKEIHVNDRIILDVYPMTGSIEWSLTDDTLVRVDLVDSDFIATALAVGVVRITAEDSNKNRHSYYFKIKD